MARLWLMRHGPTAHNTGDLIMGGADPEPLADGLEQAARLGRSLSGQSFARVFSSPLRRAELTARAVFPEADIVIDPRLAERDLGDWQGMAKRELPEGVLTARNAVDLHAAPPRGEPLGAFVLRVRGLFAEILAESGDQDLFGVTHNGVIRVASFLAGGVPLDDASESDVPFLEPRAIELKPETLLDAEAVRRATEP